MPKPANTRANHAGKIKANPKPSIISDIPHILLTLRLSNLMENNRWAKVGITMMPMTREAGLAQVLVKANGRKSLHSSGSMVNTGIKLTMNVKRVVKTADDTSLADYNGRAHVRTTVIH